MAMEILKLKDDPLAPDRFFVFGYTGKNPIAAMRVAKELLSDIYGIPGKKLMDEYWYMSSYDRDSREFRGVWSGEMDLDAYTKLKVTIRVLGADKKSTGEGTFTMYIHPTIETTVNMGTALHKVFWWIWNYFFYKFQRRRYIHRIVQQTKDLRKVVAERMGIAVKFS